MAAPTEDLTVILRYPMVLAFGAEVVGPSEEPPEITIETETYESKVQSNGGSMPVSKVVVMRKATITMDSKNIAWAMAKNEAFLEGSDVYAAANKAALALTPVTSDAGAKVLTFPNAYLEPDTDLKTPANKDHSTKVTFTAFIDATSGKLYTYATGA